MTKGKMMADFKTRLMPLFRRRSSTASTATTSGAKSVASSSVHSVTGRPHSTRSKSSLLTSSKRARHHEDTLQEEEHNEHDDDVEQQQQQQQQESLGARQARAATANASVSTAETQSFDPLPTPEATPLSPTGAEEDTDKSKGFEITLQEPSPELALQGPQKTSNIATALESSTAVGSNNNNSNNKNKSEGARRSIEDNIPLSPKQQPPQLQETEDFAVVGQEVIERQPLPRRQSLANNSEQRFIKTLLSTHTREHEAPDYFAGAVPTLSAAMLHRKIWVRRPGASATLVQINEEDLVDDVRDMILKKYANSLGRSFDSPDVTLRIVPRLNHSHQSTHGERTLGPEEPITRTLDAYFPGGQTVEEALVIDVPHRRTPRNSPRVQLPGYIVQEDTIRPQETDQGYFPAIPLAQHSPHPASNVSVAGSAGSGHHSIAVINTGQVPPLPSPGGRRHGGHRPKFPRNATSSPTTLTGSAPHSVAGVHDAHRVHTSAAPNPPPLPTPPLAAITNPPQRVATPPPRVASPRPSTKKRPSKKAAALPGSLLDGAVPPINVLIVEDNIINLRLLEAFMKRLKVRWSTAMNGRDAVSKWREGGFHLVLMDIQLPIMNGLDATKEIRRIESVNGVGVFAEMNAEEDNAASNDKLQNTELFKSPVIIVALTASSLQSDRHEALAAGCNDFLTKPVNFVWLERKVMEWGCMQALIDFDGWRKWKDFSQAQLSAQKTKAAPAASNKSSTLKSSSSTTITSTTPTGPVSTNPLDASNPQAPQDALTQLNDAVDSTNTVSTLDSIDSSATASSSGYNDLPSPNNPAHPSMVLQAPTPTPPAVAAPPAPSGLSGISVGSGTNSSGSGSGSSSKSDARNISPTTPSYRPSPLHAATSAGGASPPIQPISIGPGFAGGGRDAQRTSPKDERRKKRSSIGGLQGVVEEKDEGVGVGA